MTSTGSPSGLRHRQSKATKSTTSENVDWSDEDSPARISVLDVLRVLAGILLLNSLFSYYITSAESLFWNYRPRWTRPGVLKSYIAGPIGLTDSELLRYDGTDPKLPIYLAINGSVFDVSASPSRYGPGGSYHFFAGHDATRAYVTGCFSEDITWDLRGVEQMFMPVDSEDEEKQLSSAEFKLRREKERREARKKVEGTVKHWEDFFREGKGGHYFEIGKIVGREGWEQRMPVKTLCEKAEKARPPREKKQP